MNASEMDGAKIKIHVNYVLLALFITLSMTSHLIAYRIVDLYGFYLIPSSITYMLCFVIVDIFATFNNRSFLIMVISFEAISNLIMVIITRIVINAPAPDFFIHQQAFYDVFSPISTLYWSNIFGSFVAFFLDAVIFLHLYHKKKMSFIESSLISSSIIIIVYTLITDYLAFYEIYHRKTHIITFENIISNIVFISLFTVGAKFFVSFIQKYTEQRV